MSLTLQDILDRVKIRFPRTDSVLETMLATDIMGTYIPDVCRQYPYWFLEGGAHGGGGNITAAFPLSDEDIEDWVFPNGNWMSRGWLLLDEDVESYIVADTYHPGDGDDDPDTWGTVLVNHLKTARLYDLSGACHYNLEVNRPELYKDMATYKELRRPVQVTWVDEYIEGGKVSVFKFNPTPDQRYLVQLDWNVCVPPTIPTGVGETEVTNALMETYPEVAINLGMLAAAEYFNEARAMQYYERKLWGGPAKGGTRSDYESEGLIGRMKHDTRIRKEQRNQAMPYFRGNPNKPNFRLRGPSNFYPGGGYYRR